MNLNGYAVLDEPPDVRDVERHEEMAVLGAMLMSNTIISEITTILDASDFYTPLHEQLFATITRLYQQGPVDTVILARELVRTGDLKRLPNGAYLHQCIDAAPTSGNGTFYAEQVKQRSSLRKIERIGLTLTQIGQGTHPDDLNDMLARVDALMEEVKATASTLTTGGLQLVPMSTTVRRTRWFWEDRIPLGSLSLLAGLRDIGKTSLLCKLIADATRGMLPGEFKGQPTDVIYVFTEDSEEMTIVPRLKAAGADIDRVHKFKAEKNRDGFMLSSSLGSLDRALTANPSIKFIVLDPLSGVLTGRERDNNGAELRQALRRAAEVADRHRVAIIGNSHFRKASDADVLNRIMGSSEQGNVVRAVLAAAKYDTDEYDEKVCVLSQEKNNLGPSDLPGLLYRFRPEHVGQDPDDGSDVTAFRIEFFGETERTVGKISADQAAGEDGGAIADAKIWLRDYLTAVGSALRKDVVTAAKSNGVSERTLARAKDDLKVKSIPTGNGAEKAWTLG